MNTIQQIKKILPVLYLIFQIIILILTSTVGLHLYIKCLLSNNLDAWQFEIPKFELVLLVDICMAYIYFTLLTIAIFETKVAIKLVKKEKLNLLDKILLFFNPIYIILFVVFIVVLILY